MLSHLYEYRNSTTLTNTLEKTFIFLSYSLKFGLSNHGLLDSSTTNYENDSSWRPKFSKVSERQSSE